MRVKFPDKNSDGCHQKALTVPVTNILSLGSKFVLLLCNVEMNSLNTFPMPAGITESFVNKGHWKDIVQFSFRVPVSPASPEPGSSTLSGQSASSFPSSSLRWCLSGVPLARQLLVNSLPWRPGGQIPTNSTTATSLPLKLVNMGKF